MRCALSRMISGLSPRVRGNLREFQVQEIAKGSIPACAGEPRSPEPDIYRVWVYPRVCGGTS